MRYLTLRNLIGLAAGITAAAGVLVLTVEQPTELDFSPFLYVAVASLALAAAAGGWHFIAKRRRARRLISSLREVGLEMEAAGHFAAEPDAVERFIQQALAYDRDQQALRGEGER